MSVHCLISVSVKSETKLSLCCLYSTVSSDALAHNGHDCHSKTCALSFELIDHLTENTWILKNWFGFSVLTHYFISVNGNTNVM